jgi:hypothetical protein
MPKNIYDFQFALDYLAVLHILGNQIFTITGKGGSDHKGIVIREVQPVMQGKGFADPFFGDYGNFAAVPNIL